MRVIDLHCHILSGIDDGPATPGESVAMARLAAADGTSTIVATPHVSADKHVDTGQLAGALAYLRGRLAGADIELELLLAAEVPLDPASIQLVLSGALPTINGGRYVLVELPFSIIPVYADQMCSDLLAGGLRPIIAHPERCIGLHEDPTWLTNAVESGVLVQVNAGSLTGDYGARVQDVAWRLLREGLVHVIASDGHGADGRLPVMAGAVALAAGVVGRARAVAMVTTAPAAIIAGQAVTLPPASPMQESRPGWWSRLSFVRGLWNSR